MKAFVLTLTCGNVQKSRPKKAFINVHKHTAQFIERNKFKILGFKKVKFTICKNLYNLCDFLNPLINKSSVFTTQE